MPQTLRQTRPAREFRVAGNANRRHDFPAWRPDEHVNHARMYAYEAGIREKRIDRLSVFLGRAVREARLEDDRNGWWSRHVVWALDRLARLGYGFPETDANPLRRVA